MSTIFRLTGSTRTAEAMRYQQSVALLREQTLAPCHERYSPQEQVSAIMGCSHRTNCSANFTLSTQREKSHLKALFRTDCFISRSDFGLVVQNHVQQRIMDFQFSVVFDKAQFPEFVHEKAHARSGRADHLGEHFLAELSHDRLRPAFLPKFASRRRSRARRFSLELNN